MNKPITVSLDDALVKRVRNRQSKMITKDNGNWNFSKTIAYLVKRGLEKK